MSLQFDEKTHTYTHDGKELTSVTTFIGQYFKEFDAEKISKKLAGSKNYPDQTAEQIRNDWNKSSDWGTFVHEEIEQAIQYLNNQDQENVEPYNFKTFQASYFKMWLGEYLRSIGLQNSRGWVTKAVLRPEEKVYDKSLKLAGTIDLVIDKGDGHVTLVDWKTNKKIRKKGYRGKKAKKPISKLQDCNFNKYQLQLNFYKYILENKYGYTVDDMLLVHSTPSSRHTVHYVEDKKSVVLELLEEDDRL